MRRVCHYYSAELPTHCLIKLQFRDRLRIRTRRGRPLIMSATWPASRCKMDRSWGKIVNGTAPQANGDERVKSILAILFFVLINEMVWQKGPDAKAQRRKAAKSRKRTAEFFAPLRRKMRL